MQFLSEDGKAYNNWSTPYKIFGFRYKKYNTSLIHSSLRSESKTDKYWFRNPILN